MLNLIENDYGWELLSLSFHRYEGATLKALHPVTGVSKEIGIALADLDTLTLEGVLRVLDRELRLGADITDGL